MNIIRYSIARELSLGTIYQQTFLEVNFYNQEKKIKFYWKTLSLCLEINLFLGLLDIYIFGYRLKML